MSYKFNLIINNATVNNINRDKFNISKDYNFW